jgi:hypothetical protein
MLPDSAGIPQEIRSRCRLMPITELAQTRSGSTATSVPVPERGVVRLRGSPRYAAEVD